MLLRMNGRGQDCSPASGTGGHVGSLFLSLNPELPAPTSPSRADGECGLCFSLVLTPASPSTPSAQLPLLRQAVKSLPVSCNPLQPPANIWKAGLHPSSNQMFWGGGAGRGLSLTNLLWSSSFLSCQGNVQLWAGAWQDFSEAPLSRWSRNWTLGT